MIKPSWRSTPSAVGIGAVLAAAFVIAFATRQAIVLSTAGYDDGLFIGLGQSLASGKWLGRYNDLTLAKGPGFPAFLAIGNVLGLPFPLALGLFYAGCASFAAVVAARVTRLPWAGLALLTLLLLVPTLSDGEMMRITRDLFYSALVVAFASAAIAVATGVFRPTWMLLAITGVLGAWVWLTREEGVWLLPLAALALIPAAGAAGWRERAARLKPAGIVVAVAAALVLAFGLLNWAVYGRFVVNEIKDGAFQGAMKALQDASAPFHKTGVPVPAAARARIYGVSPAFAELKEPTLDGPLQANGTAAGCADNPAICGDFGGGWFLWNVRTTASHKGHHASASSAAAFYQDITRQVRTACRDGRLTCQRWLVPLIPPMTADEIDDVTSSFGRVANIVSFGGPVDVVPRADDLTGPYADRMVRFLNLPIRQQAGFRRMQGWYRADGAGWFAISGEGVTASLRRTESPDVAVVFKDPRLSHQRFNLDVQCPPGPDCPVLLTPEGGAPIPMDLATVVRGSNRLGAAELFFDDAGNDQSAPFLKERLSRAWVAVAARLNPLYRGVLVLGLVAYLGLLVLAARRRELAAPVVIGGALILAVAARSLILALADALAFRATSNAYALPGMLILVLFSVYAVAGLIGVWRQRA